MLGLAGIPTGALLLGKRAWPGSVEEEEEAKVTRAE